MTTPDPLEPNWWDDHTRVAGWRVSREEEHEPAPPPLRPVGRHAARDQGPPAGRSDRVGGGAGRATWPSWHDRVLLAPAQLAVVAVLLVGALVVTGWWLLRGRSGDPSQLQAAPAAGLVPTPGTGAPQPVLDGASATAATPRASPTTVTVDVAGKVRHPGLQVLAAGSRVADALSAAGGTRPGVDVTSLNLAQVLVDGQQLLVGEAPAAGVAASAATASTTTSGAPTELVDLNTATADQLDGLPEIGPVTAASILAYRDSHGGFTSVSQLLDVTGIGEVTLGKIAPYVTV